MSKMRWHYVLAVLVLLIFATSCSSSSQTTPIPPTLAPETATNTPPATSTSTLAPRQEVTATLPQSTPTVAVPAAAIVNGQPVPLAEYEAQVTLAMAYLNQQQSFDPDTEEGKAATVQLHRQILSWMVDQALIEQAAAREGISISEDKVEQEMARLIGDDAAKFADWLEANGLTHDSFRAQLQRELLGAALQESVVGSLPPVIEQVHARHILVMSEAEAMEVLVRLRSGESFAVLAQQYSQDMASREIGGDLGFFPRGVMLPEIDATAFALDPGQTSGILKTDFGYHVVQVVEKDPAREVPDEMLATWRKNGFLRWLEAERGIATIEYLVSTE